MLRAVPTGLMTRVVSGIAGLALIGMGLAPMIAKGDLFYANWWGGLVFAPMATLFGIFVIVAALFRPEWLTTRRIDRGKKR